MAREQLVVLQGGLDLVTPSLNVGPGYCLAAQNYESGVQGYRRCDGYERFDGQPKPSAATTAQLGFETGTSEPSVGATITGASSGAYGYLVEAPTLASGAWGDSNAAGTMVLRHISGTFTDGENLQVSAATFAAAEGTQNPAWTDSDTDEETYRQTAVTQARAVISALSGSGGVRGIFTYNGDTYAFRDNGGATACVLYKATVTGWSAVSFGNTIEFSAGSAEFLEGETLTGGTSGATATIQRVIRTSGAWSGSAAGYLVLGAVTSGPFQAETITSASGSATSGGAEAAITLPAGGTYRTVEHNFYGLSFLSRIYGVNGMGYAFEFDGTTLAPIRTGAASNVDKPRFIGVLSNHLFLGYSGGSLQFSGTGLPLSFDANDGAGEIGFGQDLTGLKGDVRGSLIITSANRIGYLTGTSSSNFALEIISEDSGAVSDTLEVVGQPHFLDQQGVRSLESSQRYGNWSIGTITRMVETAIRAKRNNSISAVGALRVRSKDQYRLYYADGSGFCIYFGRKNPEIMPIFLAFTPTVFFSGENASGGEALYAGASDGMVYQLDAGQSLDGAEMQAYIRLPFGHQGAPNLVKRYHRALIEVETGGTQATMAVAPVFSYGGPEAPSGVEQAFSGTSTPGIWDLAVWNQFKWSSAAQVKEFVDLNGIGENVSLVIMSDATYEDPHTLSSLTLTFEPRRQLR